MGKSDIEKLLICFFHVIISFQFAAALATDLSEAVGGIPHLSFGHSNHDSFWRVMKSNDAAKMGENPHLHFRSTGSGQFFLPRFRTNRRTSLDEVIAF